jgi:hypothetical protein
LADPGIARPRHLHRRTLPCFSRAFLSFLLVRALWGIIFLAFTPAFILAATFIGNDGLLAFFSAWFFLCVLRFNREATRRNLALLLMTLVGALFSKLDAVALLAFIPWVLWRAARSDLSWRPTLGRVAAIALVVAAWAGIGAARAWNPVDHSFDYYHGWVWEYMRIQVDPLTYLLRFDLSDLIRCGQASTVVEATPDTVRFSFPTWEYGNMLLGEYEYAGQRQAHWAAQTILVCGTYIYLGLVLLLPLAAATRPLRGFGALFSFNRTLVFVLIVALAMLFTFVAKVPNTCAADFRYLWCIAPWLALGVWRGLTSFPRGRALPVLGVIMQTGYVAASVWLFMTYN